MTVDTTECVRIKVEVAEWERWHHVFVCSEMSCPSSTSLLQLNISCRIVSYKRKDTQYIEGEAGVPPAKVKSCL